MRESHVELLDSMRESHVEPLDSILLLSTTHTSNWLWPYVFSSDMPYIRPVFKFPLAQSLCHKIC